MIKTLLRFWWLRSSENAACVVIDFARHMTPADLRSIADYMRGVADDRECRLHEQRPHFVKQP